VKRIQRAGIEVTAGIPTAMVGLLTALPGTQLARRLEREGRLLSKSTGNNMYESELNFRPVMPLGELMSAYEEVIAELYRKIVKNISSISSALDRGVIVPAADAIRELGNRIDSSLFGIKAILSEKSRETRENASLRAMERLLPVRRELLACLEALAAGSGIEQREAWKRLILAMNASLTEPIRILAERA
jgi:hypothetical protein